MTTCRLEELLDAPEGAHVEFKAARRSFDKGELIRYCVALANQRGGCLTLGVTDRRPRETVGTMAFGDLDDTRNAIWNAVRLRVVIDEIMVEGRRVLVFSVPSRPLGHPIEYDGAFWTRRGSSLAPMTPDELREIFDEGTPDFSAEICRRAALEDLSPEAVEIFRERWLTQSGSQALRGLSQQQLLESAELLQDGGITYAALILLGTHRALGRYLPDAEVIFEYRSAEGRIDAQQRENFREGLFLFADRLWEKVNLRNEVHPYQQGLVRRDIPSFREEVFREGLLNAVCHRDYRRQESVFVRQYPGRIEIESPGGLPQGVTIENILNKRVWRNRRVAEALEKADLVERSGQGVDRMWQLSVLDGKLPPDYSRTDAHHVFLVLHGAIHDPTLPRFLESIGAEKYSLFDAFDFAALYFISQEKPVPAEFRQSVPKLVEAGIIERVGRRHLMARRYYDMKGQAGVHTRKVGLDRETNMALLLKHICSCKERGCTLSELQQVLPALSPKTIQGLLATMKRNGAIRLVGKTKAGRWLPAAPPPKG